MSAWWCRLLVVMVVRMVVRKWQLLTIHGRMQCAVQRCQSTSPMEAAHLPRKLVGHACTEPMG